MKYRVRFTGIGHEPVLLYMTPQDAEYEKAYSICRGRKVEEASHNLIYGPAVKPWAGLIARDILSDYPTATIVVGESPLSTWEVRWTTPSVSMRDKNFGC